MTATTTAAWVAAEPVTAPACCPACGEGDLRARTSAGRAGMRRPAPPGSLRLWECAVCGLWFKDPIPRTADLAAYYATLPVAPSGWNHDARYPHERAIDRLLHALPDAAPVLDVGCWTGHLLAPHADRLHVFGVEPNRAAAERACARGHVAVFPGLDQVTAGQRFRAITMVDVFEHLPEPVGTLRRLVELLLPGGTLTIVTGRTDCLPVWLAGGSYWYFDCADHLVFLNRRFAGYLARTLAGVRVTYRAVRHFDVGWRLALREAAWLVAWRLGSPHSPFRKLPVHRLPGLRRLERLRQPMVCGSFMDHALLSITATG